MAQTNEAQATPEARRALAADAYDDAAAVAADLAEILVARAAAIRANDDHRRSLLLAHEMVAAFRALNHAQLAAQRLHHESLRAEDDMKIAI